MKVDIGRTYRVRVGNVRRSLIYFEKDGFNAFEEKDGPHGRSYNLDLECLKRIQKKLDRNVSNCALPREENVI